MPPPQFWQALGNAGPPGGADLRPAGRHATTSSRRPCPVRLRLSRIKQARCRPVLDVVLGRWSGSRGVDRGGSLQKSPTPHRRQFSAHPGDAVPGRGRGCCPPRRCCACRSTISGCVSIDGDVAGYAATMRTSPARKTTSAASALPVTPCWSTAAAARGRRGVRSGLAPAERDTAGQPIEPADIDRDILPDFRVAGPVGSRRRRDTQRVNAVDPRSRRPRWPIAPRC